MTKNRETQGRTVRVGKSALQAEPVLTALRQPKISVTRNTKKISGAKKMPTRAHDAPLGIESHLLVY